MPMAYQPIKDVTRLAGFCVLYAASAYLALAYLVFQDGVAAIWPASGVFLAALLLSPRSQWWLVTVALCLIDVFSEITFGLMPLLPGAIFSLSLTVQALVSAWLLQRIVKRRLHFGTLNEVYIFLLWGCALPAMVFAVPPAITSGALLGGNSLSAWWWWAVSGGMGVLVVCPFLLTVYPDLVTSVRQMPTAGRIELVVLLIAQALVTRFVFTTDNPEGAALASYSYLLFPIFLLIAIRLNSSSTILASFIVTAIAIWYDGSAQFDRGHSLVALEAFLLVVIGSVLLVAALVTERKQAEAELDKHRHHLESLVAERTADLERANKELEAFSYSVSHDLRAPLRALDGFSCALLEDYSEKIDGSGKRYLEHIRSAAQRMARLIDDILSLSKVARREIKREHANLSAIAHQIVEQLKAREPDRQVDVSVGEGIYGWGDERLINIVMENLLGNAWKYTRTTQKACIAFDATKRGDQMVYSVRDNGVGFDMRYAEKLFGSFQRLHDSSEFEGTGIGLATVQRVIHRHGGEVWAEAEVGKGATLYFTLGKGELVSQANS